MPYPTQITLEAILDLTREMIEAEGVDQLSLNKLSKALGVKTPSLYRYIKNRNDLLQLVIEDVLAGLYEAMQPALQTDGSAHDRLLAIAQAYRAYAHANPIAYGLAFTNTIPELRPDPERQVQLILVYQGLIAQITGEENSLTALRGFLALLHGFVMLEIAGQLRRGGDLDEAFFQSVQSYLRGLEMV